jgi:hypothetical protein
MTHWHKDKEGWMTQYAWDLQVRPGYEEEYVHGHQEIWPGMVGLIYRAGHESSPLCPASHQRLATTRLRADGRMLRARVAVGRSFCNSLWRAG